MSGVYSLNPRPVFINGSGNEASLLWYWVCIISTLISGARLVPYPGYVGGDKSDLGMRLAQDKRASIAVKDGWAGALLSEYQHVKLRPPPSLRLLI